MKPENITSLEDFFVVPSSEKQADSKAKDQEVEEKIKSLEDFLGSPEENSIKAKENISKLISDTNLVIKEIACEQNKIIDGIKELHSSFEASKNLKPSHEIVDFFKAFDIKVEGIFKQQMSKGIDDLEKGITDKQFINNLEVIAKPRTRHPLKSKFKQYKKLLTNEFVASLRKLKHIHNGDYVYISMILSDVNSFVFDVKISSDAKNSIKD